MSGAAAAHGHGSRLGGGHSEEHENSERWLLTYADMITLLLALFIVLFAMSTINLQKFAEFRSGLIHSLSSHVSPIKQGGSGLLSQSGVLNRPAPEVTPTTLAISTASPQAELQNIEQRLAAALKAGGVSQDVSLVMDKEGLVARILSDKVFFAVDSADLGPTGDRVVDVIGSVLATADNGVSVQGYTDNQQITGGPFRDNWDLSAERAVVVVERLAAQEHIAPSRMAAVGYGESRPLVPNNTPAHMATNRRVDVVILADASSAPSAGTAPAASAPGTGGTTPAAAAGTTSSGGK